MNQLRLYAEKQQHERFVMVLLKARILYLLYGVPPEEQDFPMIIKMIAAVEVREHDETYQSPLDELFERLPCGSRNTWRSSIPCLRVGGGQDYKINSDWIGLPAGEILPSYDFRNHHG